MTTLISVSLAMMLALAVPFALFAETLPASLVGAVLPKSYQHVSVYLEFTVITGVAVGVVNLTTTYFQAQGRFKPSLKVQVPGLVLQLAAVVLGSRFGGVIGLAVGAAAGASLSALAMLGLTLRQWPGSWRVGWRPLGTLLACLPIIPLAQVHAWLWLIYSLLVGSTIAAITLLKPVKDITKAQDRLPNLDCLHLLHLGYEDFRRPSSGGGSLRTHEIGRRLARTHEVTVLVAKYRGSQDRIEDGVRYVHIGLPVGYFPSLLAYFACIPLALHRYKADLVIEDFGAPFGSIAVPLLTDRPVVGMVQWMFARDKARQYHLPFHWVEKLGVRSHRELIAVSSALREDLLRVNPRATVHVIHNGLEKAAWETERIEEGYLLFLGRIEVAQKGLDRLIEAFSRIVPHTDSDLVIAGDGPDLQRVKSMVAEQGLGGRVHFVGRVTGRRKFDLMASARLLLMPSRYEGSPIVAEEALASRTPVVAFDLPCLQEIVPAEAGVLVAQGDVAAFAAAILDLLADGDRRRRMGEAGRAFSLRFNWAQLADRQEEILRGYVRAHPEGFPLGARLRWLVGGRQH